MGVPATTVGKIDTGHETFPPSPSAAGSSDVFIESAAATRAGDAWSPHTDLVYPHPTHGRTLKDGAPTVLVNNKPLGRIGDPLDDGSCVVGGAATVIVG